MSKLLAEGYYKVTRAEDGNLLVVQKGANHETLNASETLAGWAQVNKNVAASMRAAGGRTATMVDATLENPARKKVYYKIKADGTVTPQYMSADDDAKVPAAEGEPAAANEEPALNNIEDSGVGPNDLKDIAIGGGF